MEFLKINGAHGEGGGQIVRSAITLSCITNQPIHLENIRKNRKNGGLKPQHLTAIKILQKIKIPWSVNSIAQDAANEVIKNKSHITKSKFIIKKELKYLNKLISSIDGFECIPSSTNFILIKTKYNSTYLQKKLLKNKILIRDCKNFRGLNEHYFRIAVKSHRDNVKLVAALESIK